MVGVIVVMVLLSYVDRAVVLLFGSSIQSHFSLSDTQMGMLFGLAFIVPLAAVTVFVGWAIDRYNRVLIILAGLLLWSTMTALAGLASSFPLLLLARGGVGAGEAALAPAAYAMIADGFPPERRGRAVGMIAASVSVGTGAALIVGGGLLHLIGPADRTLPLIGAVKNWQLGFLILGAAGLPVAALMLSVRDPRPARFQRPSQTPECSGWAFLTGHKLTFFAVFGAGLINVAVGTGIISWAPTLLLRRFGFPTSEGGYILGLMSVFGGLIGAPIAASMSDRWIGRSAPGGRLHGHPWLFAVLLFGVVILGMGPSPFSAALGLFIVALALAAINALSYAAVQDLTPPTMRGKMLSALQFATLIGGYGSGPSLIAFVTDHVYADRDSIGMACITAAAPLCLCAMILSSVARRSYPFTRH